MKIILASLLFSLSVFAGPVKLWLAYDEKMLPPVTELAVSGPVIVVINPNDGPGNTRQAKFANALDSWRKNKNIRLKGYIDLALWDAKGKLLRIKKPSEINAEKERYNAIYGLTSSDGFWLDDCFADNTTVQALMQTTTWNSACIANPGEPIPQKHWLRKLPFQLCEFEDPLPVHPAAKGVWIVFCKNGEASAVWNLARVRNCYAIGFEDVSKHHNDKIKSSDLIGFTKVVITPDMVGKTVAIFTAIEVKKEGWDKEKSKSLDAREEAQYAFISWVRKNGGFADFCCNLDRLKNILRY